MHFILKSNTFAKVYESSSTHIVNYSFSQSLSVCGPTFGHRPHKEEAKNCKMDNADQSASKKVVVALKKRKENTTIKKKMIVVVTIVNVLPALKFY